MKIKDTLKPHSFSHHLAVTAIGLISFIIIFAFGFILNESLVSSKSGVLSSVLSVSGPEKAVAYREDSAQNSKQEEKEASLELPVLKSEMIAAGKFEAKSIIVKDHETGKVLFKKNAYQERPIASITKLMSALVFLETDPDWSKRVEVVSDDISGTHVYQKELYSTSQLWSAALIGSSNKAILTLADSVSWPRKAFIERMNQKAQELGMKDTFFVEPTGLDKENVSTASEVAMLLREALKHRRIQSTLTTPEYNLISKKKNKRHHVWNTNWLLLDWIPNHLGEIYGGKTGYIEASGYNFSTQVSDGEGHTLDIVILGAPNHEARFTEARDAAKWVFENYVWPDEKNYSEIKKKE